MHVVVANHADLQALGAEEQRVGRNADGVGVDGRGEVHEDVGAGKHETLRVGHVDFDVEGAREGIDG